MYLNFINVIFKRLNLKIVNYYKFHNFIKNFKKYKRENLILNIFQKKHLKKILYLSKNTQCENNQEILVLGLKQFKKNGYFVEFGAGDGKKFSNTYLLEKKFYWKGILAEPSKNFLLNLKKNRNCNIENKAVYIESNKNINFNYVQNKPTLSTIDKFLNLDSHKNFRKKNIKYLVQTISLHDLLKKYNAPKNIDYVSIDTEGSEYEILKNFSFKLYNIDIITIEHNYNQLRNKIYNLLTKNNFHRIFIDYSEHDDWYINKKYKVKIKKRLPGLK